MFDLCSARALVYKHKTPLVLVFISGSTLVFKTDNAHRVSDQDRARPGKIYVSIPYPRSGAVCVCARAQNSRASSCCENRMWCSRTTGNRRGLLRVTRAWNCTIMLSSLLTQEPQPLLLMFVFTFNTTLVELCRLTSRDCYDEYTVI